MENPEKEYTKPTYCGHCGTTTLMELAADFKKSKAKTRELYDVNNWKLLFCPVCSNAILLHSCFLENEWGNHSEPNYEVLYPTWGKQILGLPDDVALEYQSACEVRKVNSNAFGVIIGRVIDKVCIDRGATGETFYKRIESLADMGEIPKRLSDMAHNLRKLRNIGAHADLGELTDDEVPVLDDLCRAILEYVYAAPQLIEQVELRLEELKNSMEVEEETEADDDIPF